jgi:hypothetical protein
MKYCTAGFLGYDDVWHSKKAEKVHYVLAPTLTAILIVFYIVVLCLILFK